jgi:hypothetical protein
MRRHEKSESLPSCFPHDFTAWTRLASFELCFEHLLLLMAAGLQNPDDRF